MKNYVTAPSLRELDEKVGSREKIGPPVLETHYVDPTRTVTVYIQAVKKPARS